MGCYDTFCKKGSEDYGIQLKVGECLCRTFYEGDPAPDDIPDGIYLGPYGAVVIKNRIVVSVENEVLTKWGGTLHYDYENRRWY